MFENEEAIKEIRVQTNQAFISRHQSQVTVANEDHFLSAGDEAALVLYFSVKMAEFCDKFSPPMPKRSSSPRSTSPARWRSSTCPCSNLWGMFRETRSALPGLSLTTSFCSCKSSSSISPYTTR